MQNHLPKVAILKTVLKSFTNFTGKNLLGCDFTEKELHDSLTALNPIQDGTFRGCSRMGLEGVQKGPVLKSVTHILQ